MDGWIIIPHSDIVFPPQYPSATSYVVYKGSGFTCYIHADYILCTGKASSVVSLMTYFDGLDYIYHGSLATYVR